jgi:hypothetical protein
MLSIPRSLDSWSAKNYSSFKERMHPGSRTTPLLTYLALVLFLFVSVAHAGPADPDENTQDASNPLAASPPKPYSPVNTTAQGTCTTSVAACADTPCTSGHSCECFSFSNLPMKLPGVGAVGMNAEMNIDETTGSTSIGNVACLLV